MAVTDKTSRLIDRQEGSERLRSCLPSVRILASVALHARQTRALPEIGTLTGVNANHPGRETVRLMTPCVVELQVGPGLDISFRGFLSFLLSVVSVFAFLTGNDTLMI